MNARTWPAWHLLGGVAYTPAVATNVAETFRRIRAEQEAARIERERREADERDEQEQTT